MTSQFIRANRRFFWLLAAAALLLTVVALGSASPVQAQARCPLAPRLQAGNAVQLVGSRANRLRTAPSLSAPLLTMRIQPGVVWYVQSGPVCADGIHWYQVAAYDVMGWTAEGEAGAGYYLQTTDLQPQEGCYSDRLAVGMRVAVSDTQRQRVRTRPSINAPVSAWLYPGTPVTILDGPRCANNWVWWYISDDNSRVVGWTPEGDGPATPWLTPVQPPAAPLSARPTLVGSWVSTLAEEGLAALTFSPDQEIVTAVFSKFSVDTTAAARASRREQIRLPVSSDSRGYRAEISLQGTAYCDAGSQASITVQVGNAAKTIPCSTVGAFIETLQTSLAADRELVITLTVQASKRSSAPYAIATLDLIEVAVKGR